MGTSLSVCIFNMGSGVRDYFQLCRYFKPDLKFSSQEDENAFAIKYKTVEKVAKKELLNHLSDVYCLQEAGNSERPLLKSLKKRGFHLIYFEGTGLMSGVVALNGTRFQNVRNFSQEIKITDFFRKDVAIAAATDSISGKRIAFISAHVPGFDFSAKNLMIEATDGDLFCNEIVKTVHSMKDCQLHILGTDMNCNPEIWKGRFQIFLEQGFELWRTHTPTNLNSRDENVREREIDFLLVWKEPASKLATLFSYLSFSDNTLKATQQYMDLLGWDTERNPSDHRPIFFALSPL